MNLFVDIFNALRRFKLWNFSLGFRSLNETLHLITTVATVKSILLPFPAFRCLPLKIITATMNFPCSLWSYAGEF